MYSVQGLRLFGAILLFSACVTYVSTADVAYPLGVLLPAGNLGSLTLGTTDDFTATIANSKWTVTPTSSAQVAQVTNAGLQQNSANNGNLAFINKDDGSVGSYACTYTAGSLGYGVRVVARVKSSSTLTSGTDANFYNMIGWQETGQTSNKFYANYLNVKNAAATTFTQGLGYYDPSLGSMTAAGVKAQTSGLSSFDASSGLIVQVDVLPKNISWSTLDITNSAQASCGLYKTCQGTPVTSITPASTGQLAVLGWNAKGSSGDVLNLYVDWIAQFNFPQTSGASLNINRTALSIFSLFMGLILYVYIRQ